LNKTGHIPVILIGGGGHASVLANILINQGRHIAAIISPNEIKKIKVFDGIRHYNNDIDIMQFEPEKYLLVNGIGQLPGLTLRKRIQMKFSSLGYNFTHVISDAAYVSEYADINNYVQIFPGAIIQAGATIANHSVINTGAIIEHDCVISENNFIAPGAVLCGQVKTGKNVFIGANVTIIQNIVIGDNAIIAAGALVTKNVEAGEKYYPSKTTIK